MNQENLHLKIGYRHLLIRDGTLLGPLSGMFLNRMILTSHQGNNHNLSPKFTFMADEQTTKNVAYIILGISFLVMMWFIIKQARQNREESIESNLPNIAGNDQRPGNAINPEQFDEPDEEALEEMAELLEFDDD